MSAWERFKDAYTRVMATRWGYNLFGRALPSAFFLVGFLGGVRNAPEIAALLGGSPPSSVPALIQEALGFLVGLSLAVLFAIRKRPIGKPSSLLGALVALGASYFGAFIICFDLLGLRRPDPNAAPLMAGIAAGLVLVAACLLAVSVLYLGRNFGIFPEARGLVRSGPYRVFRHPIYVAYLSAAFGSVLGAFSWSALLIFAGYYAMVAWRASFEERALLEAFGDEYRRYRASTWGVGPPRPWPRPDEPGSSADSPDYTRSTSA